MLKIIQAGNANYYLNILNNSLLKFLQEDLTVRVQEIVADIFSKIVAFFRSFNSQSKEINLKPIAMISCLSLVTLLLISIFRRRGESIIPPPTPMKKNALKV